MLGRDQLAFVNGAVPELDDATDKPFRILEVPSLRAIWVMGDSDRAWAQPIGTVESLGRPTSDDGPDSVDDALLLEIERDVTPADWLVVISTSGSTAEPKGVVHTHGSTVRKAGVPLTAGLGDIGPRPVFAAMPLFWVGGVLTLTNALYFGNTLVCQERFMADEALDLIEREHCTAISAWSSVMQALREHPSLPRRDLRDVVQLAPSSGPPAYGVPLGMTESMGPYMTSPHPAFGFDVPEELRASQGMASPYYDLKLVDAAGETVETTDGNGEGEMCIRGPFTLAGLYKRERHDAFDDDGYYHTGDRVRLRNGLYFFVGRVTEMIKTNGANVAPPEVESVLEASPQVKFAFVFGIPHPEREEEVCAVVVAADGCEIDEESLRSHARNELSAYKVPRRIRILAEDAVPWLPTGKPDKRSMRAQMIALSA
jgi:acyl-CoA synthetase (AMP-forming)/AMP-acid ligase II